MNNSAPVHNGWTGHVLALVIFCATSLFWAVECRDKGVESIRTSDTTDTFYRIVLSAREERQEAVAQGGKPSLLSQIWRGQVLAWQCSSIKGLYQAQFDAYLRSVYLATGDVTRAYKLLVGPLNFVFLLGCYLLFLSMGAGRGLALLFALLSSFPIFLALAGENFGIGPFSNFSRRHLFTGFAPLALFLYGRYRESPRILPLVFLFMGLISNLHSSGLLLIAITLLAHISRPLSNSTRVLQGSLLLSVSSVAAFIALGSAWQVVGDFFQNLFSTASQVLQTVNTDVKAESPVQAVIPKSLAYLFYPPHIYSHLPRIIVHLLTGAVLVAASLPLVLRGRVSKETYGILLFLSSFSILSFLGFNELKFWLLSALPVWFLSEKKAPAAVLEVASLLILATYFVSFVPMLVFQWAYFHVDGFPLIVNTLRGSRFIGIFVFVWFLALLLQLEVSLTKRALGRVVPLLIAVAAFAEVRQLVRGEFRKPKDQQRIAALLQTAQWAKSNTPSAARFFLWGSTFGVVAEREVYLTDKAGKNCAECVQETNESDVGKLLESAEKQKFDYVVFEKVRTPAARGNVLYENSHFCLVAVKPAGAPR
jgi:hypothetical protein